MVIKTKIFLYTTLLALLIAIVLSVGVSRAATYYMSQGGTHAAAGTTSCAVADSMSIATHNLATFSDGDIIYLCDDGGAFRDQIVFPSSGTSTGITYTPYTGESPVLYGSKDGETLTWTQVGATHIWRTDHNSFAYGCGMLYYNTNTTIAFGTKVALYTDLDTDWEFFWDATDVDADGVDYCVYVHSEAGSPNLQANGLELAHTYSTVSSDGLIEGYNIDYINITGLTLKYFSHHGIMLGEGSNNWTIENCNLSYGGGDYYSGTDRGGNGIEIWSDAATITVQNNTCFNLLDWCAAIETGNLESGVTQSGITITANTADKCGGGFGMTFNTDNAGTDVAQNITLSDNIITDCGGGWSDGDAGPRSKGMRLIDYNDFDTFSNINVYGNTINTTTDFGSDSGFGIEIYGGHWNVYNNYITKACASNSGDCYTMYAHTGSVAAADADIYYNILNDNDGDDIRIAQATDGVNVYNNTFYGDQWNITIASSADDVAIKNNIMYGTSDTTGNIQKVAGTTIASDYNLFYHSGSTTFRSSFDGTGYTTLANWRTASSGDAASANSDPLFISAGSNFHLGSTSPAIDNGDNLSITSDYDGQTVPYDVSSISNADNGTDIGAYEWVPFTGKGVYLKGASPH